MRTSLPLPSRRDPREAAVAARDPAADGQFVYAVTTTGVYCRPSCPSRHARPEHLRFFDAPAEAAAAGFRPCRRCRPDEAPLAEQHAALVAELCRHIEAAETPPSLAELAARAGLSRHHLHRIFKAVSGVTPRAYAAAQRARRLQEGLARGEGVSSALFNAGFNSSGRLHAHAEQLLGMRPSTYRAGGPATEIRFAVGQCSLGAILVAASERGICAISLGDDPAALVQEVQQRFRRATLIGADAGFEAWVAQVVGFVEAPALGLALPLDVRGSAFQQRVWQALQQIAPGETLSYGELARRLGLPKACRAVAGACAANPLAVAIPCHRVLRSDGGLSGYRWGVERKKALLEREAAP